MVRLVLAMSDDACGIAGDDCACFNILGYNRAGSDDSPWPDAYTRKYERLGPDKGIFADFDVSHYQLHGSGTEIVSTSAKICVLCNNTILTDGHVPEVVYFTVRCQTRAGFNYEMPRDFDDGASGNKRTTLNVSPEAPKYEEPPFI